MWLELLTPLKDEFGPQSPTRTSQRTSGRADRPPPLEPNENEVIVPGDIVGSLDLGARHGILENRSRTGRLYTSSSRVSGRSTLR